MLKTAEFEKTIRMTGFRNAKTFGAMLEHFEKFASSKGNYLLGSNTCYALEKKRQKDSQVPKAPLRRSVLLKCYECCCMKIESFLN